MNIERKIIIGLIANDDFIKTIRKDINPRMFTTDVSRRMAQWCVDYYDEYQSAPGQNIGDIFMTKLKGRKGLPKDLAEEIEEDILPALNNEYVREGLNIPYLVDETKKYFNKLNLLSFAESIRSNAEIDDILEAEKIASNYKPATLKGTEGLELASEDALRALERVFNEEYKYVFRYRRALGQFLNPQLVYGGFIGFMAPEKRGKTHWILDMAMRAANQRRNVAFFQAGDMTEGQQLLRIAVHITRQNYLEEYCREMYEPVRDCVYNQLDTCDLNERECDFGIFRGMTEDDLRLRMTYEELVNTYEDNQDYRPCYNCLKYPNSRWGCAWIKKIKKVPVLSFKEAKEAWTNYFILMKLRFKLSTHPSGTLTPNIMRNTLDIWEQRDNFVPDMIIVDYPDLMEADTKEFRHKQNQIWMGLRRISQEKNQPLTIAPTQTDADSYDGDVINIGNYSEDKRKLAHVTAMYGLSQDHKGREKEIGILRINEILIREGKSHLKNQVHVLQNLARGRACLDSYF